MSRGFAVLSALVGLAAYVQAQEVTGTFPPVPLASKTFAYPSGIPYKVDTDTGLIRGFQHGYNICNGTTENQDSLCQTSFVNSIDDFCLWAPSEPDSVVANTEGEMVAWCTKPGHGTRLIPAGALTGVQFVKTPDYISLVGFIDQSKINIKTGDYGGEMDPHGADLRGNPMGGIMYSNAFTGAYTQVIEWHNFMGGEAFCLKACDPAGPNAAHFCEHVFDRIGCAYNVPNNAQNNVFESCKGDNQDFPGVYTVDGKVMTYTQPPEDLGAISTMPYTARVPATSSCTTLESSAIYSALPSATAVAASSAAAGVSGSAGASGLTSVKASASKTGSGSAVRASATGANSGAGSVRVAVVGVAVAVLAVVGGVIA